MDSHPMESRWQCPASPSSSLPCRAFRGSCRHKPGAGLCKQDQPLPGTRAGIPGGALIAAAAPARVWSPPVPQDSLCPSPLPGPVCLSVHLKTGKVFFKRMRRVRKTSSSQSPGSDGCTDNTALFSFGMLGMFCTAVSQNPICELCCIC